MPRRMARPAWCSISPACGFSILLASAPSSRWKKLLGPDRALELSSLTPTVEKVFRLTRMDSIFTIHPSLEVAVKHAATA